MDHITIELSLDKLRAINHTFEGIVYVPTNDRNQKVLISLLEEVIKKLRKKEIDRTNPKPFNYKFTYHHAHALERWLIGWAPNMYWDDGHLRNLLDMVKADLNQKLA